MKADEPRANRIPFMLSDSELEAIDDWRFEKRVGTRAEAIRRLLQIGMRISEPDFVKRAFLQLEAIRSLKAALEQAEATEDNPAEALAELSRAASDSLKMQTDAFTAIFDLVDEINTLALARIQDTNVTLEEAQRMAREMRENFEAGRPDIAILVKHLIARKPGGKS